MQDESCGSKGDQSLANLEEMFKLVSDLRSQLADAKGRIRLLEKEIAICHKKSFQEPSDSK